MKLSDPGTRGIKQPALEAHIPDGSALREYLSAKQETGRRPADPRPARFAAVREPMDRWPRILLVSPPMNASEGSVKRVIPPLGLSYIGAALEEASIPCDLLDCVVEGVDQETCLGDRTWRYGLSFEEVARRVEVGGYEVVGLSLLYSSDLDNLLECARAIKARTPGVCIVAGGLHISIYTAQVLAEAAGSGAPSIDFAIRGEGEYRFLDFIRNFRAGLVDLHADGLAGWHDGEIFVNPQISSIQEVDRIPFPAYGKLPVEKYFAFNVPFSPFPRGERVMQMYTSRGCPVGCAFCASTNFNKAYRARSVDNVMEEIRLHVERYAIDEIQFADDNLTFHRGRAMELFRRLAGFGLPWCTPNGTMVNTLTPEMLDLMVDSGMYQITLSLDSANVRTLRERHRKPVDLDRVPALMRHLEGRGVLMHGTLVVGMPGETLGEIQEGFDFVRGLPFHSLGVFIAQAIPGSELYESALHAGTITPRKARSIDTARSSLQLSSIRPDELESCVEDFLYAFNQEVRRRDPAAWNRKYGRHLDRLERICIGRAAPNTDGVIRAANTGAGTLGRVAAEP
ncbi:MAG TPA: Sden_1168 family B12-binding radical SAM P-methyltransferase [Longimicrobiaceae bacterium]|nr:Sden_1168 family B12-binding radical SAM P-methyltransferase [Longimicrobiaceae bacterium]